MNDIEYQLKFLLNSTTLTVDQVNEIEGSSMELLTFFKKYQQSKIVRGFMKVGNMGHFEVPMFGVPIDEKERKHRVIYCQMAVGTPMYASLDYAATCSPPNGFDSFIVKRAGIDIGAVIPEFEKTQDFSDYSYILSDPSRVLPLSEVFFTYDKELEERNKNSNICEFCKECPSVSFCLAERASFCEKCDGIFHANEFTQRHQRYYFDQVGKKKFLHCTAHPSSVIDYFCLDCNVPLCTQCRIMGSHAASPKNAHYLLTYIEACNQLAERIQEKDCEAEEALGRSADAVAIIMGDLREFQNNVSEVKEKIDFEYKTALLELNDLVKRRYQVLNARYLEMKHFQAALRQSLQYPREVDASVLVSKWKSITEVSDFIKETRIEVHEPERKRLLLHGSLAVTFKSEEDDGSVVSIMDSSYDEEVIRKRTGLLLNAMRYHTKPAR